MFRSDSSLGSRPQEIIDCVVSHLANGPDAAACAMDLANLAMTCNYFWHLVMPTLQQTVIRASAPWAGDRIVVQAYDAKSLPPACGSTDIKASPEGRLQTCRALGSPQYEEERRAMIVNRIADVCSSVVGGFAISYMIKALTPRANKLSTETQWILRNLDQKEYVRHGRIAAKDLDLRYNLGDVICVEALWSNDLTGGEGRIHGRGPWAGHRFDIVDCATFDSNGWEDVSEWSLQRLERWTSKWMTYRPQTNFSGLSPTNRETLGDPKNWRPWVRNQMKALNDQARLDKSSDVPEQHKGEALTPKPGSVQ